MSSTETMDRQEMLAAARRELLRRRLQGAAAPAPDPNALRPRGDDGPAPLSFAQQRLWVLHQINPLDTSYNEVASFQLSGELDVPALERALAEIFRRHEVLRSAFAQQDGDAVQRVVEHPAPALAPEDLRALDAPARDAALRERMQGEVRTPYDLARGPFLRPSLLRMGDQEHVLLVGLHHAVTDGWTRGVLLRELRTLYAAFARGEESPLPPLPVQYGDFAAWQRQRLQGPALRERLEWWTRHLAGAPAVLELPADRPRPAVQSFRGAYLTATLPPERVDALRALGVEEGATLFMVLMSAWQVLLARCSGQHDLVVGTPVAGRERQEVEGLMGCFVNTLALRGDLSGDPTFRGLLRRTREASVAAFARQDVPFEQVVEELRPERSTAHSPVFQAMFALQVAPGAAADPDGLRIRLAGSPRTTAKFDVLLDALEGPAGLRLGLEYATDLFDASTAQRMLARLDGLLAGAAAAPDSRISALPLLDADDRARLAAWNATERAYPPLDGIHRAFEAQARRTPDAVALVAEEGTLTYAQLDALANRLARRLAALGVRPGARVGVCLERGPAMVASLLAAMKAGAAYVPLDPGYPAARLAGMLEDADVAVLVTASRLADRLPPHGAAVLALDADAAALAGESAGPVGVDADPDLPAYVIFTSGSTGRPKGAVNAHRGVLNRLFWMQEAYGLTADDVVLQKTPFSFDVSVWEFFWPLMTGARLVVARPEGHRDPAYLAELIERERVTTVHFVPSMLAAFLDGAAPARCASLRRVVCSGEALSADLVARFHARMPASTELHNLYGPTEAAVDVTWHPCVRDDARRTVPIGRPVANTQVHVLEPSGEPAPVGIPGELHIGGVQVGLGYLGRPALTAERFVPDPFSATPGARLYRTGDRARWTAEGVLEYLGRLDFQVKVRGLRIELGEIEAALVAHPQIREAAAALRAGPAGDPLLVAYVVADGASAGADADALRALLGRSLPEYMVPGAFMALDALPLTPNGKLDRRALPDPDFAANARPYVAPRTAVERVIAGVWTELLAVDRVGVEDDFFARGGHSLLAVQAAARAQAAFGAQIPLGLVFSRPTVAGLAAALVSDPATGSRVEQVAALLEMLSGVSDDDAQAMLSHHAPPQEPAA
ncbi:MAG: amino acid adenylation domain-containing protein [Gemmatimonadetes bacterium]|nr:amino acid adenylation domain-containing protein [Gemmatimonadota bacterium]